jgi:type I restriction enzyme M protein
MAADIFTYHISEDLMASQLDVSALESWLWEAACVIRGPVDAPKFKDYILPLVFLKRLSDVFDDEIDHLAREFGDRQMTATLVEQDHQLVRFYIPEKARWSTVATITTGLGQALTDAVRAVARENPRLSGVIDVTDFNATTAGQRIVDDGRLAALVQVLNHPFYRLGLDDVEPDILGRTYEYLIPKFAEGQGQSAGEFCTPRESAVVAAACLLPPLLMLGLMLLTSPALAGSVCCTIYEDKTMHRLQTLCADGTQAVSTYNPTLDRVPKLSGGGGAR